MARILVIEDDDSFRSILRDMLEEAGHDVIEAPNGEKGVAVHRRTPVDLIVTDIFMPKQDGIGVIANLKKADPETKILAISGGVPGWTVDYLRVARSLGASRSLSKPFRRTELLNAVSEALAAGSS